MWIYFATGVPAQLGSGQYDFTPLLTVVLALLTTRFVLRVPLTSGAVIASIAAGTIWGWSVSAWGWSLPTLGTLGLVSLLFSFFERPSHPADNRQPGS